MLLVGFIFKYQAVPGEDLRDNSEFIDPNFWLRNVKAMWAICGPYKRQALWRENGGAVFFVPYMYARRKLQLPPVCTGVLVVKRVIADNKALLKSRQLPEDYKRLYKKALKEHLSRDAREAPRTKSIRARHIIVGGPKSFWLGKRCVNLVPIVKRLKMKRIIKGLEHNQAVRSLSDVETKKLYDAVVNAWRKTKPIQTPNLKHPRPFRTCKVCY